MADYFYMIEELERIITMVETCYVSTDLIVGQSIFKYMESISGNCSIEFSEGLPYERQPFYKKTIKQWNEDIQKYNTKQTKHAIKSSIETACLYFSVDKEQKILDFLNSIKNGEYSKIMIKQEDVFGERYNNYNKMVSTLNFIFSVYKTGTFEIESLEGHLYWMTFDYLKIHESDKTILSIYADYVRSKG